MTDAFPQDTLADIACIGAGPAALSVLHAAQQAGLAAFAIDKGPVCAALGSHPTYMKWFSTADKLELGGFPLLCQDKNPTRREYLKYCRAFVAYFGLRVVTYREVTVIDRREDRFLIHAQDRFGRPGTWHARNVVVCTGFYDSPRPLGIPGEDLPHVSHRYTEEHWYAGHRVVVIGAGSSACEVALELWRAGSQVSIVLRGTEFQTKYWIKPDIENRIAEGSITAFRNTEVMAISPDDIELRDTQGRSHRVPCDFVLAMTGYAPDTSLLESLGVDVDPECGKPAINDAFETNIPGIYVAGTLCAGEESNIVFVENSRVHGPAIVQDILAKSAQLA